ncbi:MAG: glutaminyl-peptide cyclotransferase [Chitinivibrionales bacterium]|nr:glutaminyl-peptide cyclotransferase [Chitinivibrionales bacterium]
MHISYRFRRMLMRRSPLAPLMMALFGLFACESARETQPAEVPRIEPQVVRTLPHDSLAFTQGLLLHDGALYESTGSPAGRQSQLRVLDPGTGTVLRSETVPNVFAEGLALMDHTLMLITWRNGIAVQYALPALRPVATPRYEGEGWGLASDGERYYMGDGSDTLFVRNRQFGVVKRIPVTYQGRPLTQLNELEYARGRIYANVWYSDFIFEIDPSSGRVLRLIDCTALVEQANLRSQEQVLNGIAYDPDADTFYLTGKDWPVMFEVRIAD